MKKKMYIQPSVDTMHVMPSTVVMVGSPVPNPGNVNNNGGGGSGVDPD